jgi:2-hydroxychromene-2-carboxylate isomerase
MKEICDAAEINYNEALHYAKEIDWNIWADEYLQQLSSLDLWGVPIFKYKDVVVWGQDRLWQIEHAILAAQENQSKQQIA